jgi:hypothetical protein
MQPKEIAATTLTTSSPSPGSTIFGSCATTISSSARPMTSRPAKVAGTTEGHVPVCPDLVVAGSEAAGKLAPVNRLLDVLRGGLPR